MVEFGLRKHMQWFYTVLFTYILFIAGCYDPALKIELYNQQESTIKVYSDQKYIELQGNTHKTIFYPNSLKPYSQISELIVVDNDCTFTYHLDSKAIFHVYDKFIYTKEYEEKVFLQITLDKLLYLIPPKAINNVPLERAQLLSLQIDEFPLQAIDIQCSR